MSEKLYQGERVEYYLTGAGNVSEGEVKRTITEPESVGSRQTVRASEDDPRVVHNHIDCLACSPYLFIRLLKMSKLTKKQLISQKISL